MTAEKPLRTAGPSTSGNVRSMAQRVVVGLEVLQTNVSAFAIPF